MWVPDAGSGRRRVLDGGSGRRRTRLAGAGAGPGASAPRAEKKAGIGPVAGVTGRNGAGGQTPGEPGAQRPGPPDSPLGTFRVVFPPFPELAPHAPRPPWRKRSALGRRAAGGLPNSRTPRSPPSWSSSWLTWLSVEAALARRSRAPPSRAGATLRSQPLRTPGTAGAEMILEERPDGAGTGENSARLQVRRTGAAAGGGARSPGSFLPPASHSARTQAGKLRPEPASFLFWARQRRFQVTQGGSLLLAPSEQVWGRTL
ncbi:hypothetical protein P7K49_026576 [Saguinus oedipus]|uniref:Uncharacterized protein n=1 Tax=Saguinus oedipus TaxID=9490 RepID=A0ABQ9UEI2_SAGOE|nr:hypothetical protein P7K49_026576 [Saguinus oedipus]